MGRRPWDELAMGAVIARGSCEARGPSPPDLRSTWELPAGHLQELTGEKGILIGLARGGRRSCAMRRWGLFGLTEHVERLNGHGDPP
jgi:hypothetical protein